MGFSSVMIDGSQPSYAKRGAHPQVVEYAHSKGTVVEGELGRLAGVRMM